MFEVFISKDLDFNFVETSLEKYLHQKISYKLKEDEPEVFVFSGGAWKNFPIPKKDCTVFIFDGEKRDIGFGGGAIDIGRIGVARFSTDSSRELGLRVLHEVLHGLSLPADCMKQMFPEWTNSFFVKTVYRFFRKTGIGVNRPFFQKKFYNYLIENELNEEEKCLSFNPENKKQGVD